MSVVSEKGRVMKQILISIVMTLLPAALLAQDQASYQCTMGDLTRRVQVMHETGVTVPCEVHYYKDSEAPGERQVLWRAMSEDGYCEAKTTEFIAKLSGMGWNCGTASAPDEAVEMEDAGSQMESEEMETEMGDDTDALAPAGEEIELPDPDTN